MRLLLLKNCDSKRQVHPSVDALHDIQDFMTQAVPKLARKVGVRVGVRVGPRRYRHIALVIYHRNCAE